MLAGSFDLRKNQSYSSTCDDGTEGLSTRVKVGLPIESGEPPAVPRPPYNPLHPMHGHITTLYGHSTVVQLYM